MSHPIHLILSAGTRIVTRNNANRIGGQAVPAPNGGGALIPAGAVGVITQSPTDAQHAYKVRFNDGAKAMLRRNEFSILKEFKNIPGAPPSPPGSDSLYPQRGEGQGEGGNVQRLHRRIPTSTTGNPPNISPPSRFRPAAPRTRTASFSLWKPACSTGAVSSHPRQAWIAARLATL